MVANLRHHAADRVGVRCLISWRCGGNENLLALGRAIWITADSAGPAGKDVGNIEEASNHLRGDLYLTSHFRVWHLCDMPTDTENICLLG